MQCFDSIMLPEHFLGDMGTGQEQIGKELAEGCSDFVDIFVMWHALK